ncbi:MAG: hypothetical protein IH600_05930 [Bacteroidetes bacterium]|nr:hypothetical protein [Bacteroidota bacterium]
MSTSWLFRMCLFGACTALQCIPSAAQPWHYDFGNATGTHASGVSTSFMPSPPSGSARVRIGSQGGSLQLLNPGDSRLGSASEARLTAPTGSSLNKIQWHDFDGSRCFTLQTWISIGGGPGDVYFFCGNGSCFSDNVGFSSSQIFAGLRWRQDSSGLSFSIRSSTGWTAITPAPMRTDSVHLLEVYVNNSFNSNSYTRSGSYTAAPLSCDIWIDGALVADDHPGAGLSDSLDIDSFMFYMAASPSNDCTLALDDITFTNSIAVQPLPVELSAFEARLRDRQVWLRWRTETEMQNFGFEIQRSRASGGWDILGFVPGDGDRQSPRWYEWTDTLGSESGKLRYRLRQIDRDGSSTLSEETVIEAISTDHGLLLAPPWPNPARDVVTLPIVAPHDGIVQIEIISLAGTQAAILPAVRLLPAGAQDLRLSCGHLSRGMHLITVRSGGEMRSRLLLLI